MPSVTDLVEIHLLRNLTDPDTYDAGVELADRGAVAFDAFALLSVRARVEDGEIFIADLRSGPGKLNWSCSEPGGSRGALCRHCVAAAVETWRRSHGSAMEWPLPEEDEAATDWAGPAASEETGLAGDALVRPAAPAPPPEMPSGPTEPPATATREPAMEAPPTFPPLTPAPSAPEAALRSAPARISGVHAIVFTPAAAEVRAFFRDVLDLPHVDAGGGWPIFALPPAELAVHPAEAPSHELYLVCEDLVETMASLELDGVTVRRPEREEDWGFVTEITLPGGTTFALYQPKQRSPLAEP